MFDNFIHIKNLLPPITVSSGIIPLLVNYAILVPEPKWRPFLIGFNLVSIWIAFICARLMSSYLFYPALFTIGTLSIGLLSLVYLVYIHMRDDKSRISNIQFKTVIFYASALSFISMGFTNYSANQGKIAILVHTNKTNYSIELEQRDGDGQVKSSKIYFRKVPFYSGYKGCILNRDEFDHFTNIEIYYVDIGQFGSIQRPQSNS